MDSANLPYLIFAAAACVVVVQYVVSRRKGRVVRTGHPYFSRVWLWPPGSHTRWEAELDLKLPGVARKVGFSSEAMHSGVALDGPTEAEIAFCRAHMADLDRLFEISKPAIAEGWNTWVKKEMPADWKTMLSLNELSVPEGGDINKPWSVTYFCEPAGHDFSIAFRDGKPNLDSVDG